MYPDTPVLSALIQSFRDPLSQASQLVNRLIIAPFHIQIIVHDDSSVTEPQRERAWRSVLRRGDVYLQAPNIHEVRAFNKLALYVNASLIVFLQGDNCLPLTPDWLVDAKLILDSLPKLALLGGHNGWLVGPLTWLDRRARVAGLSGPVHVGSMKSGIAYGPFPSRQSIPRLLIGSRDVAFVHTTYVNIGPYFARRSAFLELGGFDTQWGARGEPGGWFCLELSLRAWLAGHHVGVYYGGVGNGVGGYKSRAQGKMGRLRRSHDHISQAHINDEWGIHNATVLPRIYAANSRLRMLGTERALELQQARRESTASCTTPPKRREHARVWKGSLGEINGSRW